MWVGIIAAVIALVVGAVIGWIIRGLRPRYRDEDVARLEAAAARNTGEVEALVSERDDLRQRLDRLQASLSDGALVAGGAGAVAAGAAVESDDADDEVPTGPAGAAVEADAGDADEPEGDTRADGGQGGGDVVSGAADDAPVGDDDERTDDDFWTSVERFIDGR